MLKATDETRLKFYVKDEHIYAYYFGDYQLSKKYNSPLRNDPRPSFQIKLSEKGNIYWVDFGLVGQKYFDALGFVMHMFDIQREEAVNKVWNDLVLEKGMSLRMPEPVLSLSLPYDFDYQELRDWELAYWNTLWISKDYLDFYNVKSLQGLYYIDNLVWKSSVDNPTYIYLFSKKGAFKAYRPLDRRGNKFKGQNNGDIIEGWDQLPKVAQHLIITSSLKDTITLRRLGFIACNPTSENSYRTLLIKMSEINMRFENVFVLYDMDKAGVGSTKVVVERSGNRWTPLYFPTRVSDYGVTDPSDTVTDTGNYFFMSEFLGDLGLHKHHI